MEPVKFKCYVKPMKDPLGVSPSKGNQGITRGKEKFFYNNNNNNNIYTGGVLTLSGFRNGPVKNIIKT